MAFVILAFSNYSHSLMFNREACSGVEPSQSSSPYSLSSSHSSSSTPVSSPLDKVKWPRQSGDDPGHGIVGAIWHHQNPDDCNEAKYLVWRFPLSDRDARNIGALYSTIQAWLAYAMQTDRILVLDARNWKLTDSRCELRDTLCYFRPISSCQVPHKPKGLVSVRKADEIAKQDQSLQVIEFEGAWWPVEATQPFTITVKTESGEEKQISALAKPKTVTEWSSAALQYMWRPQSDLVQLINENLAKLELSSKVEPEKTIAMPVRASDKCKGHSIKHSAAGEETCLELSRYMEVAESVRKLDPKVDTIIFTSESRDMVERSKEYGKDGRWKFVYNTADVMQGTGSTNEATLKKSNTRTLGIQSAIVSLHMQLRAKYFVLPYFPKRSRPYSSWLLAIAALCRRRDLTFTDKTFVVDVHKGTFYPSDAPDEDLAK